MTRRILALSTFIGAAMVLSASPLSYAKDAKAQVSVEESLKFKVGDEDGNEVKALKTEMLVIRSEKRAISQLNRLLKKHAGTRLEPELLYRLAEMYMRRARSERFFEVHKTSEQILTFAPTQVKEASEAAEIRKAIAIYEDIQKRFGDFRAMDLVLFNCAFAHQQLAEDKIAESLFNKLVTNYGDSPLVADAYMSMGELEYNRKSFAGSLVFFKKVRNYPGSHVYPYSMYKAAWAYYNMQDAKSGLKELEDVVAFGRQVASEKLDAKLDLRKESLNDMALFYSDSSDPALAVSYFIAQAGEIDPAPVIMRMVELYKRHSGYGQIATVLKDLLAKLPKSPSLAAAHQELIWNYERESARPQAVAQLNDFDQYCKALKGPHAECTDLIADVSKKLASKWHAVWMKKAADPAIADSSEKAYRLYLQTATSAKDKDFNGIRFSFAELLFQEKKFHDASDQYALVDVAPGGKVDKKMAEIAPYAAIVSLERAVNNEWNDKDEARFRELSEVYLRYNPAGQYALELSFKRAFIAYEKKRYDEAAPEFYQIGWKSAKAQAGNERVLKSQDLYLDILNIRKDYKGLREASNALLQTGVSVDRTKVVEKIYREAYFSEIQQMEDKGDLKGAVDAYKKFALENRAGDLAGKAWWNASQLQFKMGDAEGGANTCYQMSKIFPNSTTGKDCLTKAADTFESFGRLDLAAKVLLNLANFDAPKAAQWRELSADFFALSGNRNRAKQMYGRLADGAGPEIQSRMFEKILELEKNDENKAGERAAVAKLAAMGVEPYASQVQVEKAEDLYASGDMTEAFNAAKKVISHSSSKNNLARARFIQAQVLDTEFHEQSVKTSLARVARVLAMKAEKLEKAQKAYQATINYGDPEMSVKSMEHLSECYQHFAHSVRDIQIKDTLSEADLAAFKAETEKMVIPMEEKGVDSLAQALEAAKKFRMHDGTIARVQNELNQINMVKTRMETGTASIQPAVVPHFSAVAVKVGEL